MGETMIAGEAGALACLTTVNVLEVFTRPSGPAEILEAIRASVLNELPDLSTGTSRARIASRAHSVRKAKTQLDDAGKALVSDWKARAKAVDVARKSLRDGCDRIASEVREPLDIWEEEDRKQKEAEKLAAEIEDSFSEALLMNHSVDLERKLAAQEAAEKARVAAEEAERRKVVEEQERAARKEQIRIKDAERAQRLAAEALRQAEEKARKAEQDRLNAARRAEQDRMDADLRARENLRLEQERAKRSQEAAVAAERARIEKEQKAKEEAARRATEDEDRRKECEDAARCSLIFEGMCVGDRREDGRDDRTGEDPPRPV
jgi:colicin import membrane protein